MFMKSYKHGFLMVEAMVALMILSGFTLIFLSGVTLQIKQIATSHSEVRTAEMIFNCVSKARIKQNTTGCSVNFKQGDLEYYDETGAIKRVYIKEQ